MIRAAITGTAVTTPSALITNDELCEAFNAYVRIFNDKNAAKIAAGEVTELGESSAEFIEKASGIRQRYVCDRDGILDPNRMCPTLPDRDSSEVSLTAEWAVEAAQKALAVAGRKGTDVDMVLFSTASIERQYPCMGIEVQKEIGATGFAFDSNVGCSSGTYAIKVAADAIATGSVKCALVVGPELMSAQSNWRDRDSHFIFGDATTAVVVEAVPELEQGGAFEIVSTKLMSKFSTNIRNNFGIINRTRPDSQFAADKLFHQQGRKVFKEVVPLAAKFISAQIAEAELAPSDVKRYWLHQANIKMNTLIAKRVVGAEVTTEVAPIVIDKYANTASCGSIISFDENHDDFACGDLGLICSFGAGYSIGGIIVRKMAA